MEQCIPQKNVFLSKFWQISQKVDNMEIRTAVTWHSVVVDLVLKFKMSLHHTDDALWPSIHKTYFSFALPVYEWYGFFHISQ